MTGPASPKSLRPLARIHACLAALALALSLAPAAYAQHYVATADTARPRLKFADSLVSINDRCIVSQAKLNPKVRPVYVNGRAVGFC